MRKNINNLVLQSTQSQVKVTGQFNDYDVTPITIQSGDFVVGFNVFNPPATYPVAGLDGTTFGTSGGNFGIRALATLSSGGH